MKRAEMKRAAAGWAGRCAAPSCGGKRRLRRLEWTCWVLAAVLLTPQLAATGLRGAFDSTVPADEWSEGRRDMYARLLKQGGLPSPVGQLELTERGIRIPLFRGTGETALTLGAGHLPETAALTGEGNIAVAGHRDGFFRQLRHLRSGDRLLLRTAAGPRTFEVLDTQVVSPSDVWVLEPTSRTTLTLITCHPFYYVGHAPDRYVVRARLVPPAAEVAAAGHPETHSSL